MSKILIPEILAKHCDGKREFKTGTLPTTVREQLDQLSVLYPVINERLLNKDGSVHRHINIYVNGEDIRFLDGLSTVVGGQDEISIIPAIAGG